MRKTLVREIQGEIASRAARSIKMAITKNEQKVVSISRNIKCNNFGI